MAKNGVVYTPIANGTFLAGITRHRVIGLLRGAGVRVEEAVLKYSDFVEADELWSCGNYSKVAPITRIDARTLGMGPLYRKSRELYWEFAHS
jgi:branched-chain amino acid aminotransferase